jgi:hypothetical protein
LTVPGAAEKIKQAVLSWKSVEAAPHRFGGTEYRIGKREIGHVHGDQLVDIPFPKKLRDALVASAQAQPHHVLPESGWISFYLKEEQDIERAIELFRRSYDVAIKQQVLRGSATDLP